VNIFDSGQVLATPGALAALEASGESLLSYLGGWAAFSGALSTSTHVERIPFQYIIAELSV
jgi:hypothetical protein